MKGTSTATDQYLFAQIAQGDREAFAAIYFRYTEKLLPHVTEMMRDETWGEEVVQEVFIRLWEVRHTLTDIEHPSAFLYRMAANKALNLLKHQSMLRRVANRHEAQVDKDTKNPTQDWMDAKAVEALLQDALHQLPPQQKLIYSLQREKGLSQDQIAAELNLSKNTVRNHMAEALRNIRRHFLRHGLIGVIAVLAEKW